MLFLTQHESDLIDHLLLITLEKFISGTTWK